MNTIISLNKVSNKHSEEKTHYKKFKKSCQFPDCEETFYSTAKGKFCDEHRKPVYRKVIDKEKNDLKRKIQTDNNPNQTIKHSFSEPKVIIQTCQLKGCNETFEILVLPRVFIYPQFCEEHRSEYKRSLFIKVKGNKNGK